jgi:hypothetical protein
MDMRFKILSVAAAAILAGLAAYNASAYWSANTTQALEAARQSDIRQADAKILEARVATLAKGGCQSQANAMLTLHAKQPIKTLSDIPKQLGDDLILCIQRGILSAFLEGDLRDAGLLKMLKPGVEG